MNRYPRFYVFYHYLGLLLLLRIGQLVINTITTSDLIFFRLPSEVIKAGVVSDQQVVV